MNSATHPPSPPCNSLAPFDLYGWKPDPTLSADENYMDIVLLLTRSSTCKTSGRVACILVDPSKTVDDADSSSSSSTEEYERQLYSRIIGAATNSPLFEETDSDIHAEISCLGQACNAKKAARGCTAYITIAPCKKCFAALVAFQVGRIVSRQLPPKLIVDCAARNDIQVSDLTRDMNRRQMARINGLINEGRSDEELMEFARRRKAWREQRKQEKREKGLQSREK